MLKINIKCILITSSKNQSIINKSLEKMKFIKLFDLKQKNFNQNLQKIFFEKNVFKKFNMMINHNYDYKKFLE